MADVTLRHVYKVYDGGVRAVNDFVKFMATGKEYYADEIVSRLSLLNKETKMRFLRLFMLRPNNERFISI